MSVHEELSQINKEFGAAFAEADIDQMAGFYTDDAVFLEPGAATLSGRDRISEKFRNETLHMPLNFESGEILEDGDLVADIGYIKLNEVQVARYVVVYRRQDDGTLKIAVDAPFRA